MLIVLKSQHPFRPVSGLHAAGGIMLCYGISLAIGYSILLKFDKAAICCLLAIIGGFTVARWYKKEVKSLAQTKTFSDNSKQQA